ncbi:hypothetical protein ACJRO7_008215 [Eucalyptus globulus]|uniref:TCP domain-containing protein n=1 Tax=Eucalyptus globulus TaxID=34317 RepID=A0ABD3IR11_EUCGL
MKGCSQISKVAPSSSSRWSLELRNNPRVVRIPRTFGGKDRHSKVRTVRGLRDRRIRLSAPAAVQLYYLQDILGLTQPSKVIDWLIEAARHDIEKLPPLQIPQGFSEVINQQLLFPPESINFFDASLPFTKHGLISPSLTLLAGSAKMEVNEDCVWSADDRTRLKSKYYWDGISKLSERSNEFERGCFSDKSKQIDLNVRENQEDISSSGTGLVSDQNLLPTGLLNNTIGYRHYIPGLNSENQFILSPSNMTGPSSIPSCSPCWTGAGPIENEHGKVNHFPLFNSGSQLPSFTPASLKLYYDALETKYSLPSRDESQANDNNGNC